MRVRAIAYIEEKACTQGRIQLVRGPRLIHL